MCLARFWKASYFSFREKKKIVCGSSLSKLQFGVKKEEKKALCKALCIAHQRPCLVQAVLRLHSQTDIDSVEHTCANFSVLDRVEPATHRSKTPFDL